MHQQLEKLVCQAPAGCTVADAGCADQELERQIRKFRMDAHYVGIDKADGGQALICDFADQYIPLADDTVDLTVSCHVLEHLNDPISHCVDLVRITRPGGYLYIETPSDRSVLIPSFPGNPHYGLITNFYDDPTHIGRPWSPQSLFRLGKYLGLEVVTVQYDVCNRRRMTLAFDALRWLADKNSNRFVERFWQAVGWNCIAVFRKTAPGKPEFNYYSFKRNPNGHSE